MTSTDLIALIRGNGRSVAYLAREIGMDPSLLRKKLRGQRPPLTEAQARHLRAILGIRLEEIPHIPDTPRVEAVA